jgi:hypothetical protein
MAPSTGEWEALSMDERATVVAGLPGEVTDAEMSPPEGDLHFRAKISAMKPNAEFDSPVLTWIAPGARSRVL